MLQHRLKHNNRKRYPMECTIISNINDNTYEGEFIKLMNILDDWFALVVVSDKLERFDIDQYNIKIL